MHFGFFIFFICLEKMPLAIVTALFFVSPFFIAILAKLFLDEKVGIFRLAIISIAFIGVILIVKPNAGKDFEFIYLAPLFTAFAYASAMIISNYTGAKENAFVQAFQQYFVSLVLSLLSLFIIRTIPINLDQLDGWEFVTRVIEFNNLRIQLTITVLSIFGCLAIVSLIHAYQIGSPISNGPIEYILLVLAVINGIIFLNEFPDLWSVLGMIIVVCGGLSLFFQEKNNRPKKT
jgi:drug/metabolite transporter (DMT)-like permease